MADDEKTFPGLPADAHPDADRPAENGDSADRLADLRRRQAPCDLCPRHCLARRDLGRAGYCGAPLWLMVASVGPHFGEERVLVGTGGSGAVFLSGCNLRCVFCQNHEISHTARGQRWAPDDLVYGMLGLQNRGCENVNFVSPTHYAPQLAEAIVAARRRGLRIPIVYNCSGYESVATLRLLEGLIDIYMPDFKFWSPAAGQRYCAAADYPELARQAVREMHRQVGDLVVAEEVARRGLLVRHLVMPGADLDGCQIMDFLARDISPRTFVNVMSQYRPRHRAADFPEINRPPTAEEFSTVVRHAQALGLRLAD